MTPATSTAVREQEAMRATSRLSSPDLVGAAEDDVLDLGRVDARPLGQRPQRVGPEVVGPHADRTPPWRPTGVRTAPTIHASF